MTRKDLLYIAIILAILTVSFWIGKRDGKTIEQLRGQNEFLQREVDDLTAARDSALIRASRESSKRAVIVLAAGKEQGTLKAEIRRLKAQRLKTTTPPAANAPTPVKIDSTPLLANCDSLTEVQNSLIVSLDNEKIAITNSFEKELTFTKAALESETAIATAWQEHAQSNDKKLKRQKFWTRVWRSVGLGAVAAAGVIAVTSQ